MTSTIITIITIINIITIITTSTTISGEHRSGKQQQQQWRQNQKQRQYQQRGTALLAYKCRRSSSEWSRIESTYQLSQKSQGAIRPFASPLQTHHGRPSSIRTY
jgi:hypothetical protein